MQLHFRILSRLWDLPPLSLGFWPWFRCLNCPGSAQAMLGTVFTGISGVSSERFTWMVPVNRYVPFFVGQSTRGRDVKILPNLRWRESFRWSLHNDHSPPTPLPPHSVSKSWTSVCLSFAPGLGSNWDTCPGWIVRSQTLKPKQMALPRPKPLSQNLDFCCSSNLTAI